jgi:hypothetical protein
VIRDWRAAVQSDLQDHLTNFLGQGVDVHAWSSRKSYRPSALSICATSASMLSIEAVKDERWAPSVALSRNSRALGKTFFRVSRRASRATRSASDITNRLLT